MENASDRVVGVDATPSELENENEIERQLVELRRSYQVSVESLGLPVLQLTFPHIEESQPVIYVDDAPDVDDELAAPDDWIPPGEQHEI
jgi:hypothetical protein